jgi:hypothetical protein
MRVFARLRATTFHYQPPGIAHVNLTDFDERSSHPRPVKDQLVRLFEINV